MPFPRWTKTGLCPVIASLVYLLASRVVGAAAADGNAPDALPRHAIARLGNLNFQHGAKIRAVAWSPNGRLIASAGASVGRPTIRIWDASAGSELSAIDGPKSDCHSLSFSRDARLLALASGDGTTHVYEVLTGREVRQVPHVADVGPRERIGEDGLKVLVLSPRAVLCHAAFSPGGSLLASAHGDGVLLCEPVTGKQVRKLPGAAAVAWSPDGKMLATARAGRDAPITLYDSNTGGEIRQLKREGNGFSSVAFSSDGNCVVGAALGREALRGWAYVWNVHSGQELRSFQPDKGSFACVACSPTKGIVALVHPDNSIVLYDLEDGRELRKLQGHGGWVRGVAFSPDGRTLASVGWDRFVHLWDVQTGKERIGDCPGHRGPVSSVTFTGDGKRIVTGGEDGTVRLWDPTGKQVKVLSGHEKTVSAVALSPGGRFIASCSQDGNVCLWEAPWDSQAPALQWQVERPGWLRFDPGAKRLLCVSSTGAIVSLDPAGRKDMPSTLPSTQPGPPEAASQATGLVALSSVSFSADARLVAAGAPAVVRVTDVSTGREIASIKSLVRNFPRAVAMSAYGDVLACVTENAVSLVEVDSGQEIAKAAMSLAYSEPVTLAFSSDGALLAAGVGDGSVTIFQAATGKELLRLDGHRGQVNCLCFSRDGRSLVSGSADGTALLWDLQDLPDRGAPGAKKLDERELKSLWEDLAGKDVAKAHAATWAMAAGADEAAAFLRDRLKPAPQADADRVKKLIEELDSAKFAVRQNAFDELAKLGPLAEDHLRKALRDAGSEELKQRLNTLLKALVSPAMRDTELLRTGRAIAALERIGTPAAVKFLEALAAGAESARSTQQAKAALGRLAARAQTAN